jgi:antitoxin VapB
MNMQINIKSREARELVDEITKRTGETLTEAVTCALKARLHTLTIEERRTAIIKLTKEISESLKEPWKSVEHGELLYDDKGLPK